MAGQRTSLYSKKYERFHKFPCHRMRDYCQPKRRLDGIFQPSTWVAWNEPSFLIPLMPQGMKGHELLKKPNMKMTKYEEGVAMVRSIHLLYIIIILILICILFYFTFISIYFILYYFIFYFTSFLLLHFFKILVFNF